MTETSPLVSVIIPTRDRLPLLKQAVDSVLAQTLCSCQAVVVDDASSDGTAQWLAEHESERLTTVVLEDRHERSFSRNRGLEKARGRFILFLDDDDRLRASALEELQRAVATAPDAIGAVGAQELFDAEGNRRRFPHPRWSFKRQVWTDLLGGWMSPLGAVLFRTQVIRMLGGFNEEITTSEDYELFLRASRRGPVVFVPNVVLEKRTHKGQWRLHREVRLWWRPAYVDSLPPRDRRRASAALRASRLWNDGRIAYGNLESQKALSLYWQAVRLWPSLLISPVLRPQVVWGSAKSVVGILAGRRGLILARRVKQALRRALGRAVEEVKTTKGLEDVGS